MASCDAPRTVLVRGERYPVSCGSRYCPSCGERWAKDQRIRAVAAARELSGDGALITLTGPGNAWFLDAAAGDRLSVPAAKRWWNFTARERYAALFRAASRGPREHAREDGADWRVLYRTWEWQKRRVLHVHLVLPYGTEAEQAATDEFVSRLHDLARDFGFGFVLGGDSGDEPSWEWPPRVERVDVNAVAAYVSKYVSKGGPASDGMVSVARSAGMRGSVLYIAPGLLRASGVSMTTLRNRRSIATRYPWARSSRRSWEAARFVATVQRGRPPLTQQAVDALRAEAEGGLPTLTTEAGQEEPTKLVEAPEPPGLSGYAPRPPRSGRVVRAVLASVLLHVPEPENLGWWRTDLVDLAATRA